MQPRDRILLEPVGYVSTEAVGDEVKDKTRTSIIFIKRELIQALKGLEDFSHLFVIFWLNQVAKTRIKQLKVHPRGRKDMPLLGVFATRTNIRPNPIGLTLVELIEVRENVLTVRGLDAFDGTPVLDIKPFDPWDTAKDVKVPEWWIIMNEKRNRQHEL
jgi:tRNA (adenine37-N6)-methyltransferase